MLVQSDTKMSGNVIVRSLYEVFKASEDVDDRLLRVYKCALVAKGLFSLSFPRLVFSKTPAPVHSSRQVGKRSARPRPSW